MALIDTWQVVSQFSQKGSFAKAIANYQLRDGQVEMAEAVADNINNTGVCAIEGGTGIGKSFAYIVPALYWLLANPKKRVVISTATIHLQQQLVEKDIPFVLETLDINLGYALLKGRGNYLCLSRLQQEARRGDLLIGTSWQELLQWAKTSEDGSYSDLPTRPEPGVWELICSDGALCLGNKCSVRENCFFMKARMRAESAALIVVNNHLLFADIQTQQEDNPVGAVIPAYHQLIFDEAHNMAESAISLFTKTLSAGVLVRSLRRVFHVRDRRKGALLRGLERTLPRKEMVEEIPAQLRFLYDTFGEIENYIAQIFPIKSRLQGASHGSNSADGPSNSELPPSVESAPNPTSSNMQGSSGNSSGSPNPNSATQEYSFVDLSTQQLEGLFQLLQQFADIADRIQARMIRWVSSLPEDLDESRDVLEWKHVAAQVADYREIAERLISFETLQDQWVAWFQQRVRGAFEGLTLYHTPIDVSTMLREEVFLRRGSVTAVSATLQVQHSFDFWFRQVGLDMPIAKPLTTKQFESPFLYKEQVKLLIPTNTPVTSNEKYIPHVVDMLQKTVPPCEGGVLILFTSYTLLEKVYQATAALGLGIRDNTDAKGQISAGAMAPQIFGKQLLKQGEKDRFTLIKEFKERPSILFATSSFWEGVDFPGDVLQLLIITKLPFAVPSTPIHRARSEQIFAQGEHPFPTYFLPQAILKLRQGFGRLIRKDTDSGTVVLLDSRIVTKSYGSQFLRDLPDCDTRVGMLQDLEA